MLPRQFRLPSSTRFVNPIFVNSVYFTLRYMQNNKSVSRFGFVAGKKIDKRAVVRNRIKRVVRSCVEDEWVKKIKGVDVLFILKPHAILAKREDLCRSVEVVMNTIVNIKNEIAKTQSK